MGELDTLRLAGGARGVDERAQRIGAGGRDRGGDRTRVGLEVAASELVQFGPGDDAVIGPVDGSSVVVEQDDRGDLAGQFVDVLDLVDLPLVLGDEDPAVGVTGDVQDVGAGGVGIDGGRCAPGAGDGEVGDDPFVPGGRGDRHPLLELQAQRQQAGGHRVRLVLGLGPGVRRPGGAADGIPIGDEERGAVGRVPNALGEHLSDVACAGCLDLRTRCAWRDRLSFHPVLPIPSVRVSLSRGAFHA